jgi:hypothetical protein
MSEKHYNRANGVKAISDLQYVVQEVRQGGKRRERELRRMKKRAGTSQSRRDVEQSRQRADGDKT